MYLKRLEIQGFKSFAKKTVLEFQQGITAIVGPNGSGKSNIADCLRWVLGEQSSKLMRGKKSDDVIFAGSDKKVKLGFAEVVATFDNGDHKIPVDASEVSIGRRIDRSGESEYLLNGNKVRLLDIVDLVLKSNIGTSRYTVIGQGTIDQMILAGPQEVKNLLDEASGVKTYYIKREKTLRRLEQTAQNLMRAEDLMAEIEPRLKSLRRQAKRMEARGEIETELRVYQREWFGQQYWHIGGSIEKLALDLGVLAAQRQQLELEILGHRKAVEAQEGGLQKELEQYKQTQEDIRNLQEKKNQTLESVSLVRGKMESHKTASSSDPQTLQITLHKLERDIADAEAQLAAGKKEIFELEKQYQDQKQAVESLASKLELLYQKLSNPVTFQWSTLESEVASLEQEFESFYQSLAAAATIDEVRLTADKVKHRFLAFKQTANQLAQNPQTAQIKLQAELQALAKQKDMLTGGLNSIQVRLSTASLGQEFLEKQKFQLEQDRLHTELEFKKASATDVASFWQNLVEEENRIKKDLEGLAAEIGRLEQHLQSFYESEEKRKASTLQQERHYLDKQDILSKVRDQESLLQIEKAKLDTHMEALMSEAARALGQEVLGNIRQQKTESTTQGLEDKIAKLKHNLDLVGGVDELTMKEYQETDTRYTNLSTQVTDLKKGVQDLRDIIEELDVHIKVTFNEAFHKINAKFESYFRLLFNGGRAYLTILKAEDKPETEEGIDAEEEASPAGSLRPEQKMLAKYERGTSSIIGVDIKATPAGKKLSAIQALSGGERALTSIALLCSLLSCFPSPFVVLDEVDAALDDANTIRFGQILGTLAHQTQFITITHNRETMAQANILYGVTMGDDGISKLLSVKLDQAKVFAK